MIKLIHNLTLAVRAVKNIKNWPVYFLDYFNLIKKQKLTYILRNNIKYVVRGGGTDRGIITSVCLEDEYLVKKEGIKDNSVIIDIGAQIGIFSVFAASSSKTAKVYSFEPVPANFKLLTENIKINHLKENIKAHNLAVGEKDGQEIKIFLSEDNTGGHSIISDKEGEFVSSKAITLKTIFEENNITRCNLLKMDCEGSEYPIFYNAPDEVFEKIDKIYLEYHNLEGDPRYNGKSLKDFLEKKGFAVTHKHNDPLLYARK